MKRMSSALVIAGALFLVNIQKPPVADKAIINAPQETLMAKGKTYKVDLAGSTLGWTGTKPSGKHNGTVALSGGSLQVKKGKVLGGNFTLDMKSIADTDMQGGGKEGLEKHLKSPDFFDVEKYPTAMFEITGITSLAATQHVFYEGATHNISGNLTMHGVTKNISFPAMVNVNGKSLTASADFNVDRTEWGISYGSDGKVAKEINLKLNLNAGR
jgi:polyisoprenoid-binding protein YceI